MTLSSLTPAKKATKSGTDSPASLPLVIKYSAKMPRSSSAALMKIIMPPLWPTSAAGPGRTARRRSSVKVTRRLLAQILPMQLGPETASPVSAITAASSRPSAAASRS
jgi:hypothetical protein